ncbi:hypothetical protein C8R43DRAFT_964716 [Mycena crocata]|nr:hypothetical protein C8R43DRAFT_964716 [Mycena crocata]
MTSPHQTKARFISSSRLTSSRIRRVLSTTDSEKTLVEVQTLRRNAQRATRTAASAPQPTVATPSALVPPTPSYSPSPSSSPSKPKLYRTKRMPQRRSQNPNTTDEQASSRSPSLSLIIFPSRLVLGRPTIPTKTRQPSRAREPSYAAQLRTMLRDVVKRKAREAEVAAAEAEKEEEEEKRLLELLDGRVVGGADKFGCIKIRRRVARV